MGGLLLVFVAGVVFGMGLVGFVYFLSSVWATMQRRKACEHEVKQLHGDARNLFNARWMCWKCGKRFKKDSHNE